MTRILDNNYFYEFHFHEFCCSRKIDLSMALIFVIVPANKRKWRIIRAVQPHETFIFPFLQSGLTRRFDILHSITEEKRGVIGTK